jgi:hypothetical protein
MYNKNKKQQYYYKNKDRILSRINNKHIQEPWIRPLIHLKQRCENKNDNAYKDYGGRGIKCLITKDEVKVLWFRDKAYLMEKPSIDRKDNNGNYCFNNCQFLELPENSCKDKRKPILQYDLNNNFIKEWNSQSDASRELKISTGNLSQVCQGKRPTASGYIWRYKNASN